ncbi:hypothetical protein [Streptomyces sp. NPDC056399]
MAPHRSGRTSAAGAAWGIAVDGGANVWGSNFCGRRGQRTGRSAMYLRP